MVDKKGNIVATSDIWNFIKDEIEGESYGSDEYHIADHILYKNTITKLLEDKFGAEPKNTNKRNKVIFNPEKLRRIQRSYNIEIKIKTTLKGEGSEGCEGYVRYATPSNNGKDEEFARNRESEGIPVPHPLTQEPSLPSQPSPSPSPDPVEMSDEDKAAMIERYNRLSAQSRKNWNAASQSQINSPSIDPQHQHQHQDQEIG
jgi:hypothetical protein